MTKATENVSFNMNVDLIELLDAYCVRKDLHRSQAITRAVKVFLALDAARNADFIDILYSRQQEKTKCKN